MAKLDSHGRARLPDSAFAYVDSRGRRRLPINDESHVRNALSRFNQVAFESDAARERARKRLLKAAKTYGIVPIGFITRQLDAERNHATAGRLVIEMGRNGAPGELEKRLRTVLRDPGLLVLNWSDAAGAWLDSTGRPVALPGPDDPRTVTYLEREGKRATALVHQPGVLEDSELAKTVIAAVRFAVQKDRRLTQIPVAAQPAAALPTGFVTLMMTDIESSTALVRKLGDRYSKLLNDVRNLLREAVATAAGREIDVRADDGFAIFERAVDAVAAAVAFQRSLVQTRWPDDVDVRVRIGLHSGCPTLTDVGYIGLAVHTTARVCAAAHGGQIIVSGVAVDAAGDLSSDGIRFVGLGRHRLVGLPDAEDLFQVQADGLPAVFEAPRTDGKPEA
jgi:class 3 adenylate cyclase